MVVEYEFEGTVTSEQRPATATTIFGSHFQFSLRKATSKQRPPVNNDYKFRVPRVNVVDKFDGMRKYGMD